MKSKLNDILIEILGLIIFIVLLPFGLILYIHHKMVTAQPAKINHGCGIVANFLKFYQKCILWLKKIIMG